jgi:hypothetical protein
MLWRLVRRNKLFVWYCNNLTDDSASFWLKVNKQSLRAGEKVHLDGEERKKATDGTTDCRACQEAIGNLPWLRRMAWVHVKH